jgi:hypothetical protein
MLVALGAPIILLLPLALILPPPASIIVIATTVVIALSLLLFYSLTTEVSSDAFSFRFGVGIIRRTIPIGEIEDCRTVSNPWYFGWGIHLTPRGWLYNVSGLEAVEIDLRNGKRLLVGSDEPEALCNAISAMRRR